MKFYGFGICGDEIDDHFSSELVISMMVMLVLGSSFFFFWFFWCRQCRSFYHFSAHKQRTIWFKQCRTFQLIQRYFSSKGQYGSVCSLYHVSDLLEFSFRSSVSEKCIFHEEFLAKSDPILILIKINICRRLPERCFCLISVRIYILNAFSELIKKYQVISHCNLYYLSAVLTHRAIILLLQDHRTFGQTDCSRTRIGPKIGLPRYPSLKILTGIALLFVLSLRLSSREIIINIKLYAASFLFLDIFILSTMFYSFGFKQNIYRIEQENRKTRRRKRSKEDVNRTYKIANFLKGFMESQSSVSGFAISTKKSQHHQSNTDTHKAQSGCNNVLIIVTP